MISQMEFAAAFSNKRTTVLFGSLPAGEAGGTVLLAGRGPLPEVA